MKKKYVHKIAIFITTTLVSWNKIPLDYLIVTALEKTNANDNAAISVKLVEKVVAFFILGGRLCMYANYLRTEVWCHTQRKLNVGTFLPPG